MHIKYISLFLLSLVFQLNAQDIFSLHKYHKELYGKETSRGSIVEPPEIIPLQFDRSAVTGKSVFGFLPYWEYPAALDNVHWDLMTHIAAFDFQVDSLGNISNPSGWPWSTLINTAHTNGVKVIMTAVNFTASQIHNIITNQTAKQNFFSKVSSKINTYQLDGINIDFEGLNTADRGGVINSFMSDLTNYVHTNHPGKEVSFAGPAVNWSSWVLTGLAASCDYIFIMGYDFAGSWSTTTAPPAPLTGGSYNITNTVTSQYNGCPPEKLILGVPYYGAEWIANTNQPGATISSFVGSVRVYAAIDQSQYYTLLWHTPSQTSYYVIPVNNKYDQVWFDEPRATGLKFALAKQYNLKGIGMWAMNYDRNRPELWAEISKYLNPSAVENEEKVPVSFEVSAYPNPFNPATTTQFSLAKSGIVSLSVYDITGTRVWGGEAEEMQAGTYTRSIDLGRASSGTYFLRIELIDQDGVKRESLKLQLLK